MEDIFSTLSDDESGSIIDDLSTTEGAEKASLPISALRNRAASIALLNSKNPVEDYQANLGMLQQGVDPATRPEVTGFFDERKKHSQEEVLRILADSKVGIEDKKKAIAYMQNYVNPPIQQALVETALQSESKGETIKQENARLNTSAIMQEMLASRIETQNLINAHAASLNSETGQALKDLLITDILPFSNNAVQARIRAAEGGSAWDVVKAFLLPGSDASKMQDEYANLPPQEAQKVAIKLMDIIGKSGANINDYAEYSKLQRIANGEESATWMTILENVSPILDIFGIKSSIKSGKLAITGRKLVTEADKMTKMEKALGGIRKEDIGPAVEPLSGAGAAKPNMLPDESLISKAPVPPLEQGRVADEITALEAQKAKLLENQNLANKGDIASLEKELAAIEEPVNDVKSLADSIKKANPRMSSKEARKEAEKRLADQTMDVSARRERIVSLIEENRSAAKVQQEIADIEKKVEGLKKGLPDQAGSGLSPLAEALKKIEWNSVIGTASPASPGSLVAAANPSKGRNLFAAAVMAQTDEAAQAIFGANKIDTIATNVMPQVTLEKGAVATRTVDIGRDLEAPESIADLLKQREGLEFTEKEVPQIVAKVKNDFSATEGIYPNDAMGGIQVNMEGGIAKVSGVYGTPEGGFDNAVEAMEQVKYALKGYGVKDSDIELLKQVGDSHVPVKLSDVADEPGNYFVRLNMDYEAKFHDIGSPEFLNVRYNVFDRFSATLSDSVGSLMRHVVDAASMVHKSISGAATRATDLASGLDKIMIEEATQVTDALSKLKKDRQNALMEYFKEANYNRLPFDPNKMQADGFSSAEIDVARKWRNFWDTHYYLENYDLGRTLSAEGYELLDNGSDKFIAKKMGENVWNEVDEFYDPVTQTIMRSDPVMKINVKQMGGTFARLRRPVDINGTKVSYIMVDNSPKSYLRSIRDSDQVLNKIDGYYSITYTAPKFVDRIELDATGREIGRKAVAVAGDTQEAQSFARRQISTGNEIYRVRDDSRAFRTGSDDWWDVNEAMGRISQRHRGQTLEDASGLNHLGDGSYVLSPIDSAVRASRSIAGRAAARPMLENAKARFVSQYRRFLVPDTFGEYRFPNSVKDIGALGEFTSKELADARTTFEYIRYLENGYINSIDDFTKQLFNAAANAFGKRGLTKLERGAAKMTEVAPAALAKNTVFNAYIASHVLRQLVVQPHQVIRTIAYNPRGWATGSWHKSIVDFANAELSGVTNEFHKFVVDSRMLDGVDKQNLVRGSLESAADHSNKLGVAAHRVVIEYPRRIGFDIGEKINQLGHLAAVFDLYKRNGKNLKDVRVRAEAFADARAIGYSMNYANDMPYNQNAFSIALQFFQVPHKALLQATNRQLDLWTKTKLLSGDLLFFGAPTWVVYDLLGDELEEYPEIKKAMVDGGEAWLMNAAIKQTYGTDKEVDFGSLSPYDLSGWMAFLKGVVTGGGSEILGNSAAGSLFAEQGRVANAARMIGRYFSPVEDENLPRPEFDAVVKSIAEISSGFNDYQKAKLIWMLGERRDKYGNVTEEDLPGVMAVAQLFGFGSKTQNEIFKLSKELNDSKRDKKQEIYSTYRTMREQYANMDETRFDDVMHATRVTGMLMKMYEGDQEAMMIIRDLIEEDFKGKDLSLQMKMIRAAGVPDAEETKRLIERHPTMDQEMKNKLYQTIENLKNPPEYEE